MSLEFTTDHSLKRKEKKRAKKKKLIHLNTYELKGLQKGETIIIRNDYMRRPCAQKCVPYVHPLAN